MPRAPATAWPDDRINLKAMYNDPSQMRESLAWRLFGEPIFRRRGTYAKLAFDTTYRGLFSVIEHVDKKFLRDHFGENHLENLYKTGCRDIGCARPRIPDRARWR